MPSRKVVSICSAVAVPLCQLLRTFSPTFSNTMIASLIMGMRIALAMKPGESFDVTTSKMFSRVVASKSRHTFLT